MIFNKLKELAGPFMGMFGKFLPQAPAKGQSNFDDFEKEPKSLIFASIFKLFESVTDEKAQKNPQQAIANSFPKVMLGVLAGIFGMFLPQKTRGSLMNMARPFLGSFFGTKDAPAVSNDNAKPKVAPTPKKAAPAPRKRFSDSDKRVASIGVGSIINSFDLRRARQRARAEESTVTAVPRSNQRAKHRFH